MTTVEAAGVNTWIQLGTISPQPATDKDRLLEGQPASLKTRCVQGIASCTASKPASIAMRVVGLVGSLGLSAAGGYCMYTAFTWYPSLTFVGALTLMGGAVVSIGGLCLSYKAAIGLSDRIRS